MTTESIKQEILMVTTATELDIPSILKMINIGENTKRNKKLKYHFVPYLCIKFIFDFFLNKIFDLLCFEITRLILFN